MLPDHPVIQNMERTGYPDGRAPEYPHCPICHEPECGDVYMYRNGDIAGCEDCIESADAYKQPAFQQGDVTCCPICGSDECDTAYIRSDGSVAGCNICIKPADAWGQDDCFD